MSSADDWHPLALSGSIDAGTLTGTRLFGKELVVWRDEAGVAHVWEDRCPHRGLRLSIGFVRGSQVACLYHGWHYGPDGRCVAIPAHPELVVPGGISVVVLPVREAGGMIWTSPGGGVAAALPMSCADAVSLRSIHAGCDADLAVRTLLQMPPDLTPEPLLEGVGVTVEQKGASLLTLSVGSLLLNIGVQRIADDRTALHVSMPGEAPDAKATLGLLHWLIRLRRVLGELHVAAAEPA